MREGDFALLISEVGEDLLCRADRDRRKKQAASLWNLWTKLGAAAAIVVLIVGVIFAMPYIPREYDLEYEYYAASEGAGRKLTTDNVYVYYVKADDIARQNVRIPMSIYNVFLTWKHLNGIGDEVVLLDPSHSGGKVTVSYTDRAGVERSIGVSVQIQRYFEQIEEEKLLLSLEKTMIEYEKKARDVTSSLGTDAASDKENNKTPGVTPTDKQGYTEQEKETLYKMAVDAREKGEYQYAHALFSLLSLEGYRDSTEQRTELMMYARAVPFLLASYRDAVKGGDIALEECRGVMYIGEGGTVRFAFLDEQKRICDIAVDESVRDVVSLTAAPVINTDGYPSELVTGNLIPNYYQCLCADGSVRLIYDPAVGEQYPQEKRAQYMEALTDLEEFVGTLEDVVMISSAPFGFESVYLHSDGRVSMYIPTREMTDTERSSLDYISGWRDIVDIGYRDQVLIGLYADGSTVRAYFSSGESNGAYEHLGDESVRIHTFGMTDRWGACGIFMDERAYSLMGTPQGSFNGNGYCALGEGYLYSVEDLYVKTDGSVEFYSYKGGTWRSLASVDGIRCIFGSWSLESMFALTVNGRLIREDKIIHENYDEAYFADQLYILENITIG